MGSIPAVGSMKHFIDPTDEGVIVNNYLTCDHECANIMFWNAQDCGWLHCRDCGLSISLPKTTELMVNINDISLVQSRTD